MQNSVCIYPIPIHITGFYIGVHNDAAELIIILEFLGFPYLIILSDTYFIDHCNKKKGLLSRT